MKCSQWQVRAGGDDGTWQQDCGCKRRRRRSGDQGPLRGKSRKPLCARSNVNALARISTLFSVLWRTATCYCCKSSTNDDYKSSGGFHAALSVKWSRQRDQRLQGTDAGVKQAFGKRDQALAETKRRSVCFSLILDPTAAEQDAKNITLNTLWVILDALESGEATARELPWSYKSARTFAGMFHDDGNPARLLCTYTKATRRDEGITR